MKHRSMWLGLLMLILSGAISVRAQGKFEVTPFAGYETSGSYPVSLNSNSGITNPINQLRVNDALAYGTFLDYNLTENFQIEFMWDRNNTSYSARQVSDGSY